MEGWKVDFLHVKETNLGKQKRQTLVELKREGRRLEEREDDDDEEGEEIFFFRGSLCTLGS